MLLHLIAKLLQYRKPSTNGYKNVHNSVNIIKTENDKVNHVHCMGGKYYPKIKMHDWTLRVLGKNKLNDKVILTPKAKKKSMEEVWRILNVFSWWMHVHTHITQKIDKVFQRKRWVYTFSK